MDKKAIIDFIEGRLAGTDYFPVEVSVSPNNEIKIEVDSDNGVDIDFCVELTRAIEEAFSRDEEDYELEVGSAGLTSPFKVRRQYDKNIGEKVEVLTRDGRKLHGILVAADDTGFDLESKVKVKHEGAKRPVEELRTEHFAYDAVKSVCVELDF